MEGTPILAVVAFMAFMLVAAWPRRAARRMLLAAIFFVLSFGLLVEGVLGILGPEELYTLGMGPVSDLWLD